MDAASVRVNSTTLREFAGRIVRVVGKVESFDGASELARLNAGGPVDVLVPPGSHLEEGKIYEIIGKASVSDFKINAYSMLEVSDNTNLDVANKLATYVQKVPELFYST
ncbi:CIC11C00000002509 [Sungouiella intermedia]|uniref:CIC11C00000002509 n=1 Tax=Sungouiella intermedia TaxID=45354 RepID=A0A1L0DMQ3_9ASCO|nr:CIC11C00000002509 [[Candida] intermedia]